LATAHFVLLREWAFLFYRGELMNEFPEKTTDELWDESQRDDATASVDDEDSDALGTATAETNTDESSEETPDDEDAQFEDALFLKFSERFKQEVLPSLQQQVIAETMNRTRQSMKARDEELQKQLAPLVKNLQKQQQQGYITAEDANAQYQEALAEERQAQAERELQAQQHAAAQAWAAQGQTASTPTPGWATTWEQQMNLLLERSGLKDTDPEFQYVPLQLSDPDPKNAMAVFKQGIATALEEKKVRLAKERPAKPKSDGFVDMGTGGGAGKENPIANVDDPDQLWALAKGG
jgi:hypothetical protein